MQWRKASKEDEAHCPGRPMLRPLLHISEEIMAVSSSAPTQVQLTAEAENAVKLEMKVHADLASRLH